MMYHITIIYNNYMTSLPSIPWVGKPGSVQEFTWAWASISWLCLRLQILLLAEAYDR